MPKKTYTCEYVKIPVEKYNRICNLLTNLQSENKGIKGFFSRWKISAEPLRADAKTLWDELCFMESRRQIIAESRQVEIHSENDKDCHE